MLRCSCKDWDDGRDGEHDADDDEDDELVVVVMCAGGLFSWLM